MTTLDDIANDPKWQPASDESIVCATIPPPRGLTRKTPLTVVVKELGNGLLYALVKDNNNRNVAYPSSFAVDKVPELPNQYLLIDLLMNWTKGMPGFFATFEYKDRATDKDPNAWLNYTLWHIPILGDKGLTMLTNLRVRQAVKGGYLSLNLNATKDMPRERGLTAKLFYTGESDGRLHFDIKGNPIDDSVGFYKLPQRLEGPLGNVFRSALAHDRIDALETAVTLVKDFPSRIIVPIQLSLDLGDVASKQYEPINNKENYSITIEELNKAFQQGNVRTNFQGIRHADFGVHQMELPDGTHSIPHKMLVQMPEYDIVALYLSIGKYKLEGPCKEFDRSPQAFANLISKMVGDGYEECHAILILKGNSQIKLGPNELKQRMAALDYKVIDKFLSALELPPKKPVSKRTVDPNTFVDPFGYKTPSRKGIEIYTADFARMIGNVYVRNMQGIRL